MNSKFKLLFWVLWMGCVVVAAGASNQRLPSLGEKLKPLPVITLPTKPPPVIILPASVPELRFWIDRQLQVKRCNPLVAATLPQDADENGWWAACQYKADSEDSAARYQLLSNHLTLGRQLLTAPTELQRRQGLGIVLRAAHAAVRTLNDVPLAVAICDGWVLPNLAAATAPETRWLGKKSVLNEVQYVFTVAKDRNRLEKLHKLEMIHLTDRNDVDCARGKLAGLAQDRGDLRQAVEYLKGIDSTHSNGMFGARSLIPVLENQIVNPSKSKQGRK
jgi:hypothetical protein